MERTTIRQLYRQTEEFGGKTVTVMGWARTIRDSKAFGFIELNDGSFFKNCQIVFEREKLGNYDEIARQNVGASLVVTGEVVLTPENRQPFEIKAAKIEVMGTSSPDYPLQKKRHSMEFLREIAYLRPRTNTFGAVFKHPQRGGVCDSQVFQRTRVRVRAHAHHYGAATAKVRALCSRSQLSISTRSRGEVDYKKDFFGKKASLTVSGPAQRRDVSRWRFADVYTFGPTFRAERSNTTRHAAEFWMIEPEMAFCRPERQIWIWRKQWSNTSSGTL